MKPNNYRNYKGYRNQSGGFIEFIVAVIIAIVMLRLLGINLSSFLAKPTVREFAFYVKDILVLVWNDLAQIVSFVRNVANGTGGPAA
jgi:hypothetical protein